MIQGIDVTCGGLYGWGVGVGGVGAGGVNQYAVLGCLVVPFHFPQYVYTKHQDSRVSSKFFLPAIYRGEAPVFRVFGMGEIVKHLFLTSRK